MILRVDTNTNTDDQAQIKLFTTDQMIANRAKAQSLLFLARTELWSSEGDIIRASDIAKQASIITMRDSIADIAHQLAFFHCLGFLIPASDCNGKVKLACCADVAKELAKCGIKTDAKVFSELVASMSKTVRAYSKGMINTDDAGKHIARLVNTITQLHEYVELAPSSDDSILTTR